MLPTRLLVPDYLIADVPLGWAVHSLRLIERTGMRSALDCEVSQELVRRRQTGYERRDPDPVSLISAEAS